MARLIDADVIVKGLNRWKNKLIQTYGENDEFVRCIDRIIDNYIDNAPTIDAEPVRHGHWDSNGCCTICGKCAACTEWDTPVYGHWNGISRLSHFDHHVDTVKTEYCPNCGAKMDE